MEIHFDPELMRRYDTEGPRYTSYPTATQFHEGIPPDAYEKAARNSRGALELEPLSLYVHIPFCFSPCFYCGCNKVITRQVGRADPYMQQLMTEISLRSAYFDRSRKIEQLHLGGGTPTFLPQSHLAALIGGLGRDFQLIDTPDRDYSIEIDPRTVDAGALQTLSGLGFNRVSLGVQDFDEGVQRAINRIQPAGLVERILEAARRWGFRSINFDLIYGLPRQSLSTFECTLDQVIAMRPDRLAVYGYAHMPKIFKAQRQILSADLPESALRLALLQLAVNKLTGSGYVYIGMDHFALPSDPLAQAQMNGTLHRSFQGYTTHASRDLISVGVSAIGQIGDLYIQNRKTLLEYAAALNNGVLPMHRGVTMSRDDAIRKDVIQQIMCHGSIDIPATERRQGIEFDAYFQAAMPRLRNVAMSFDAYLGKRAQTAPASRVI
jgi:oxygen-independent coproporphyrinogen III oxidase